VETDGQTDTHKPSTVTLAAHARRGLTSLIPRQFQPPVFDCLQYANMEGKGLRD